ncbi:MAG: gfo/Idh/MocA family oxidoreductase [Spirochaetaceae bacterium]|nr:MAG: gfo/Idh/MocA family oxidoreductase [Spirochaetaceae bacterium]
MSKKPVLRTLVVGIGSMGASHAKGYAELPGFEIAGIVVARNVDRAGELLKKLEVDAPIYTDYYQAMAELRPDVVSINTYTDTHAEYSIHAMRQGCHVFMEKPIAQTIEESEEVVRVAAETGRKLVIGYILRVHPAWTSFIEYAQTLGKPLIMRMNLNQQSYGHEWEVHKTFIRNMPPLVDCGVHYVDVMCQMTRSKPKLVQGIAARVSPEIDPDKHNYGALQVVFEDESVGWYEVGWGPMMSKVAFFVKDVIGPNGCVSIDKQAGATDPSDVSKHTTVDSIILHSSRTDSEGRQLEEDKVVRIEDEPDHDELCKREQAYLYEAITEDIDLTDHLTDAVNSLKICFAAVDSYNTGQAIHLA